MALYVKAFKKNVVEKSCNLHFFFFFFVCVMFLYPHKQSFGEYTGVTPSVRMSLCQCVTKSCPGHNFISIKASNFKLHTQICHIAEECSVQEP